MKKYYLAYGSNLNLRQMVLRCPTAKAMGTAVIKDYELLSRAARQALISQSNRRQERKFQLQSGRSSLPMSKGLMCMRAFLLSTTRLNSTCP